MAVSWIQESSDDELADYLPQLVQVRSGPGGRCFLRVGVLLPHRVCVCVCSSQAVKFECHLKNALVMFLLSRAQANVNIAHHLYW